MGSSGLMSPEVIAALETELSDALTRCAAGDRSAFELIYRKTSGPLYALVRKVVKDDDLARDVLQKAYLSIWQNAGNYEPGKGRAFSWMLVIMRNRAVDEWRRQQKTVPTETLCETIADDAVGPARLAEMGLLGDVLRDHLARLPQHVATVIRLNVVHGLSCREIAVQMNMSANTVRSWLRRGLERLRQDLPIDTFDMAL